VECIFCGKIVYAGVIRLKQILYKTLYRQNNHYSGKSTDLSTSQQVRTLSTRLVDLKALLFTLTAAFITTGVEQLILTN
jgi:hypothetical protein